MYCWDNGTTDNLSIKWVINPKPVRKPNIKDYLYNGSTINVAELLAGEGYTISGQTCQTNVGTYEVTIALKESYAWSDSSAATYTAFWKIKSVPVISFDTSKTVIRESDVISSDLFNAVAVGSNGESIELVVTVIDGTQIAGESICIQFSAISVDGVVKTKEFSVDVYGIPKIVFVSTQRN